MRREGGNDCFTTMGWKPVGQSRTRRLKATWRTTVEKKRGKDWEEELESSQGGSIEQSELE